MNQQSTRVLIGIVWLATVAGAYFIGQTGTPPPPLPSSGATANATSTKNSDTTEGARSGRIVESFSGDATGDAGKNGKNVASIIARARAEMSSGMAGMNF